MHGSRGSMSLREPVIVVHNIAGAVVPQLEFGQSAPVEKSGGARSTSARLILPASWVRCCRGTHDG